jgi:hypothetical protein
VYREGQEHPLDATEQNGPEEAYVWLRARALNPRQACLHYAARAVHAQAKLLSFPPGRDGESRFSPHDEGERARFAVYALNRRAAEAATVRAAVTALLDDEDQERPVVVLGDLNDEVEAATTQILQGPPGSEIGTGGYDQPDTGDGPRLWNLAARIPEGQRFSRRYRGRGELIDHILVVAGLAIGRLDLSSTRVDPLLVLGATTGGEGFYPDISL